MIVLHYAHNLVLVACYTALGTFFLYKVCDVIFGKAAFPGYTDNHWVRGLLRVSAFTFFVGCAYTHFEMIAHTRGLPPDMMKPDHVIPGVMQAIGASVFTTAVARTKPVEQRITI